MKLEAELLDMFHPLLTLRNLSFTECFGVLDFVCLSQ